MGGADAWVVQMLGRRLHRWEQAAEAYGKGASRGWVGGVGGWVATRGAAERPRRCSSWGGGGEGRQGRHLF